MLDTFLRNQVIMLLFFCTTNTAEVNELLVLCLQCCTGGEKKFSGSIFVAHTNEAQSREEHNQHMHPMVHKGPPKPHDPLNHFQGHPVV